MNDIVFATYSVTPKIYGISSIAYKHKYKNIKLKKWSNKDYLTKLLYLKSKWVVHIDEDAFITNIDAIENIITFMKMNDYVCTGMPDGGIIPTRFHNPVICNPYFLIINRDKLYDIYKFDNSIESYQWDDKYRIYTPDIVKNKCFKYEYDDFEEYYKFFYWVLSHQQKILYLDANLLNIPNDNISNELLDNNGIPFLIHSWYSREYYSYKPTLRHVINHLKSDLYDLFHKRKKGTHYDRINNIIQYYCNTHVIK